MACRRWCSPEQPIDGNGGVRTGAGDPLLEYSFESDETFGFTFADFLETFNGCYDGPVCCVCQASWSSVDGWDAYECERVKGLCCVFGDAAGVSTLHEPITVEQVMAGFQSVLESADPDLAAAMREMRTTVESRVRDVRGSMTVEQACDLLTDAITFI